MSPEVLERVFHLLTWLNCQETDELVTKFITNFSSVSEQLSISFLFTCLDHPTPARVDTAVILLTDRPSLVDQFEQLFVKFSKNRLKERYAEGKNEARFLEADSQWSVCLPLINFYISSVTRGKTHAAVLFF